MNITNIDGTPCPPAMYFALAANETSEIFTRRYVVDFGGKLAVAGAVGGVVVKARRAGTSDPFVNVSTTVISLTPYIGTSVDFDFQVTAGVTPAVLSSIRLGYAPI